MKCKCIVNSVLSIRLIILIKNCTRRTSVITPPKPVFLYFDNFYQTLGFWLKRSLNNFYFSYFFHFISCFTVILHKMFFLLDDVLMLVSFVSLLDLVCVHYLRLLSLEFGYLTFVLDEYFCWLLRNQSQIQRSSQCFIFV